MRQTEPLVVQIVSSFDQCPVSQEAWDEAVARLGGPVYMTFDWLKTWWEFYGRGKDLRLFVFKVEDKIVGLLPIYVDCLGIWPLQLKVGRLVGANIPPKVFDPPLDPDWAALCLEHALRLLTEKERADVISLGPVSSNCSSWQKVSATANRLRGLIHCSQNSSGVYTVFRLPSEMQDYLKSLSKNEQKNRRKYELRTLQKEHAVRVDVIGDADADLCSEFDRFAVQHTQQWQAEGKSGHFGAWPDGLAYNRALVQNLGHLGRVRFVRVWADDQVVANQYIFAFAGRWWWELPSRIVGEKWDRFSLGPSGIVTMLGEAIKEGISQVEGGLGHYEYKLRLKAEERPVCLFRVLARRQGTRLRYRLFTALRWLLERAYHKLWYRRLAPHLPACFRAPQWTLWLRFNF